MRRERQRLLFTPLNRRPSERAGSKVRRGWRGGEAVSMNGDDSSVQERHDRERERERE